MPKVYERVAASLENLVTKIQPEVIVPVGFDGAVIYHLLAYKYKVKGTAYKDQLQNVVHMSSRINEFDLHKLETILPDTAVNVYFLDLRTKTGCLGAKIKNMTAEYLSRKNLNCKRYYAVLFGNKADICGDPIELSEEERTQIYWVDGRKEIQKFIRKDYKGWEYKFTHEAIAKFKHVAEIKEIIKPTKKKALTLDKT